MSHPRNKTRVSHVQLIMQSRYIINVYLFHAKPKQNRYLYSAEEPELDRTVRMQNFVNILHDVHPPHSPN